MGPHAAYSHVWHTSTHSEFWWEHSDDERGRGWQAAGNLPPERKGCERAHWNFVVAEEGVLLQDPERLEGLNWGGKEGPNL